MLLRSIADGWTRGYTYAREEVEVAHDGALNCIKMRNAHTHPLPPPGGRPTPPKVFPERPD